MHPDRFTPSFRFLRAYCMGSRGTHSARWLTLLAVLLLATGDALAQSTAGNSAAAASNAGVDEHARLMQAYMAKRAEWVALRDMERKRANATKDTGRRQAILLQLDEDERILRLEAAELARQLKAAAKKKQDDSKPRG